MVRISLYQALLSSCYCRPKLLYIVSFVCYFVICLLFILISAILLNKICTKGTYLPERSLPFWPVLLTIRRWYIVYFSVQTPKMLITNNIENREAEFLHSGVYSNSLSVNEVTEISRCSHLPSLSPTLWLMFFCVGWHVANNKKRRRKNFCRVDIDDMSVRFCRRQNRTVWTFLGT